MVIKAKIDIFDIIGLIGGILAGWEFWQLNHHIFWCFIGLLLLLIGVCAGGFKRP